MEAIAVANEIKLQKTIVMDKMLSMLVPPPIPKGKESK